MSRRPLLHPMGQLAKSQDRMSPGGRVWSESPIPRRFTPRVPMAGEDPPPVVVEPVPPTPFYTPELYFTGAKYWQDGPVSFTNAYWNGAPLAPIPDQVWTVIAPYATYGYSISLWWVASGYSAGWAADIRITSSGRNLRWWSTLPDAAGTGSDNNTLLVIAPLPTSYFVHQSDVKATPSLHRVDSASNKTYGVIAPHVLQPVSGSTPVSGSLRFSISSV